MREDTEALSEFDDPDNQESLGASKALCDSAAETEDQVEIKEFRKVLGSFATGVAIVTTLDVDDRPVGLTINTFSSLSLTPPLVLWAINLMAPSLRAFRAHCFFGVSILSSDQKEISDNFARPRTDKFEGVHWTAGRYGVPLIEGGIAQLECYTVARWPGGDHEIYVGRPLRMMRTTNKPLIYFRGSVTQLAEHTTYQPGV